MTLNQLLCQGDFDLLGFMFDSMYYIDRCLPMRCSVSCKVFQVNRHRICNTIEMLVWISLQNCVELQNHLKQLLPLKQVTLKQLQSVLEKLSLQEQSGQAVHLSGACLTPPSHRCYATTSLLKSYSIRADILGSLRFWRFLLLWFIS